MPKVPDAQNCTVKDDKIIHYLLVPRSKDDKSKFLFSLVFTVQDWQILAASLKEHVSRLDGIVTRRMPNGHTYEVTCNIQTPNGRNPCVHTYWEIIPDSPPNFITLVP